MNQDQNLIRIKPVLNQIQGIYWDKNIEPEPMSSFNLNSYSKRDFLIKPYLGVQNQLVTGQNDLNLNSLHKWITQAGS